eukprot:TRINITY_DN25026_c0_g1_i3.p1 TRINITY_DN25026_c0_g1~~TRINITY_DN25026_c0_g1_i3.p1  ORF type:complete len:303 (+),score=47.55 TRINITY_DN25026_c0_g1_i3:90-911(+)
MESSTGKRVAVAVGVSAAVAALAVYLFRDDGLDSQTDGRNSSKASDFLRRISTPADSRVLQLAEDEVWLLLRQVASAQEDMKRQVPLLVEQVRQQPRATLQDVCAMVKRAMPSDPLEMHGLTLHDFEHVLRSCDCYASLEAERARLLRPSMETPWQRHARRPDRPPERLPQDAVCLTAKDVLDIHEYLLSELQKLLEQFTASRLYTDEQWHSAQTVTVAVQVMLAARRLERYGASSEDVERAIALHREELGESTRFRELGQLMQVDLTFLMRL